MKHLFTFFFILAGTDVEAAHYLLKNPKENFSATIVQSISFGPDTFFTVEADGEELESSLFAAAKPELISKVAKIGFLENAPQSNTFTRAWHPDYLRYADLPNEKDGVGIVVAVLDTGVDYKHPALAEHMWSNSRECANMGNGLDNDGNGFANDCHGYDFTKKSGDPFDRKGHGTHCAGIIASDVDPISNAQGIAPGVKIMSVRVIGDEKKGFVSNAAAGIKYAVDNGAKIISGSWRLYRSEEFPIPNDPNLELLRAAFQYADDRGVIFVTGAGNESGDLDSGLDVDPLYPASFSGLKYLVVVTASDQRGYLSFYANFGRSIVTIAAPGDDIVSTVPGGGWAAKSGTSMATPLVAGLLARGLGGGQTPSAAVRKLMETRDGSDYWGALTRAGGILSPVRFLAE